VIRVRDRVVMVYFLDKSPTLYSLIEFFLPKVYCLFLQDECTAWTNEKHNSYLDYLESSFVRQLYSLLGGGTQRLSRTRDVQSNSHKSADQVRGYLLFLLWTHLVC